MPNKRLLLPALIGALVFGALTLAATGKLRRSRASTAKPITTQAPNPAPGNRRGYVRRSRLSPRLIWHLNALGDRLEKPGKERLTITGELRSSRNPQVSDVVAIFEPSDRLLLRIQDRTQTRIIQMDGGLARTASSSVSSAEEDLIEAIVYDTAEHFFETQMQARATRFLGARFRTDDGSNQNYSGPYYDVYQVADQVNVSGRQREQTKLYYFNSETLLLERVSYEMNRDGSEIKVEEIIGDWEKDHGQQVARRIERFENGKSVFVLTMRSASLSSRADDGIFTN